MTLRPPSPKSLARTIASHDQQLRHLSSDASFSWDNFRFGTAGVSFSAGNGTLLFNPEFDDVCFSVVCWPQRVVGFNWNLAQNAPPSPQGVTLTAWQYDGGSGYYTGSINVVFIALGA